MDRRVFPRPRAEFAAFGGAPPAEKLPGEGRVHPLEGRPVERVAQDKSLARAVADVGNQKPRLAHFAARGRRGVRQPDRSEEHTSELQSPCNLVCRLLLEKKKKK